MNSHRVPIVSVLAGLVLLGTPAAAAAYGGPGSAITAIGAFLAMIGAVVAAIFGFFWFPIKKLLRRLRRPPSAEEEGYERGTSEDAIH